MEKISVVIPTYNRSGSIQKSVESVLNQTYPVQEVIVVDDCSLDNTEEVLQQMTDSRIRYYRLPENRGAGGARNFGVEQACFDLIAFHDSDDIWMPEKIERQMQYWEQHPDCGLIYCPYVIQIAGDNVIVPDAEKLKGVKLEGSILADLLLQNSIGAPTVLMKKKVFEEAGGFDETMQSLEDWDFAIRVAQKSQVGFLPKVLVEAANSEGSVSADKGAYYQNRCYIIRKYLPQYLETNLLNIAVKDILGRAERSNVLKQVTQMLMLYLEG